MKKIVLLTLSVLAFGRTFAQTSAIQSIIEKDGRHALLVDGKPFLILGGQAHNSSGWPGMMPRVWKAVEYMHANTLEVPIYWEQIEPQQGKFDFSVVDVLLSQARAHHTHLVLLWFATWKNGSNHYMPEWMKREAAKYPNITGKSGKSIDSPSPQIQATLDADTKAFASVMRHLKVADPQHTVIMVQVENESGSWDSVRDYSPTAEKLIAGPVPAELLKPEILAALNHPGATGNTWREVFGKDADEYFHAWSIARFVGKVAAAGKAAYALPMYTNAALRDPLTNPSADNYESGGPTDNVIPIWKAAAPALNVVAPDIYLDGSERVLKVIELYNRKDNALFVPEAGLMDDNSKYLYSVIAGGGIGFSPFGIDDNGRNESDRQMEERLSSFANDYAVFEPMMRELAAWSFGGKIKAVVEREGHGQQIIDLGAWQAVVTFVSGAGMRPKPNAVPNGKLMIVQLAENKFIAIGANCHITFHPAGNNAAKAWQYLRVEEGSFNNGTFNPLRILNGDETDWGGPFFGTKAKLLQIELVAR